MARARAQVDKGQSGLARATLCKAAEAMRHQEEERRGRYVAGITALYNRARDIALASYDGEAAANAIVSLAEAIHGADAAKVAQSLNSAAVTLYEYGRDRGSNMHLTALIILRQKLLAAASSDDVRGAAHDNLGTELWTLGERESGTARLEEAVAAYRAALKEYTQERVPLQWAMSAGNQGVAMMVLADRKKDAAMAKTALGQIEAAFEAMRSGGHGPFAANYEARLPEARAIFDRLQAG